jgi:thioredoxin-like negative regulator of GroEL
MCTFYNVRNLPTFIAIDEEEKEIARFTGVKSPDGIKQWIDSLNG